MAMASQVPPKWCFGRDLSEMSWSLAKTVGTILNRALLNFLSQEKGKWFKKAFDGKTLDLGPFWNLKSSIIARISITDFSKPRFNFNSHWKFSEVFFQTFELCRRYNSYCWEENSGGILKRGQEKWQSWQISAFADKKDHRVCQYLLLIGGESVRTNGQTRPYWFSISTSQRNMKPMN